uniref:Phosphatidylinositol-3-phosphatase n=1 Tax=Clytia hemisphaerica TaxID=252671 RepID=A0A7M5X7A4_9CNID
MIKRMASALWYVPTENNMYEDYEDAVDLNVKNNEPLDSNPTWRSSRKAWLKVSILQAKELPAMDPGPNGKADPYCIVKFGNEEHITTVQQRTTEPVWNETFIFEVDNIPQTAFPFSANARNSNGKLKITQVPLCELLYYIHIDIWDKDTLNRDDYMGKVIIPVASIPMGNSRRWYSIGRTPNFPSASGKIEIALTLRSLDESEPMARWAIDDLLFTNGERCPDFQLPLVSGNDVIQYPGRSEHVEFVMDDVLVEISGHRGLGRIYLTDFRLVILCTDATSTNLAKTSDLSMYIPLNLISSVERGDEQKVIRKTEAGTAGTTDVKTLILKCEDFRTIRFTFLKSKPNWHTYLETKFHIIDEVEELEESLNEVKVIDRTVSVACKADVTLERDVQKNKQKQLVKQETFTVEANGKNKSGCISRMFHVLHKRLKFIVWNGNRLAPTLAFVRTQTSDFYLNGWDVYLPEEEFKRQQINSDWKLSTLNGDYSLSATYPKYLYVPAAAKKEDIRGSATFRAKGRIPTLTWFNRNNGTFIMRCSQPKTGATGKYSVEDEALVQAAKKISPSERLVIFDARSMLAAGGNRLKGKGTEDIVNRYQGMKLLFLDIANIHAMRDSVDKLFNVCDSVQENKWYSQLESTHWMSHLRSVLKGATLIARYLTEKNVSVLVHCSDGWDRTPQLTSIAQVLLDPFYRTREGFKILVMKDWISFGHKFNHRLGDPSATQERSPVFLQFLDCICQILMQFPNAFEFNNKYLVRIAEHLNSGWFGNFFFNTQKDLEQENIMRTATSLWAHLDAVGEDFVNPSYDSAKDEVLYPIFNLRRLYFWKEYYLRYDDVSVSSGIGDLDEFEDRNEDLAMAPTNTVIWVPDERVRECGDCKQKFTGIRRRVSIFFSGRAGEFMMCTIAMSIMDPTVWLKVT